MHAHAAVHKDRVEISLSIIQLKNCSYCPCSCCPGAILDFRYDRLVYLLNLPDVVEKFIAVFGGGFVPLVIMRWSVWQTIAVAARVTERCWRIAGIYAIHMP